ncbi:MAG: YfaZ family outer membrane protein [Aquisalimonadaceae bacterium]
MLRRCAIAAMLFAATTAASQASELEFAVSDEMAEVLAAGRTSPDASQNSRFGGGILFNDEDDLMGTLFLQVNNRGSGRWQPVTFGVGAKAYVADLDRADKTVGALGLGGDIGIGIPAGIPMSIILQGYLSPTITTSGNAKRVTDVMVRLEAEVTRGAHAFLGYRRIKVHSNEFRDTLIDDGPHAGIRLQF